MKICIGIISYLPPNEPTRSVRRQRAIRTIEDCNRLFPGIPILVVAQCWKPSDAIPGALFSLFDRPLGILGARKELRSRFLRSKYDCIIMLDDDAMLSGTPDDGREYVRELESHPGCFGERNGTSLKLFSICRELLEACPFPEVRPENGEGYEDRAFVSELRKRFPERRFVYLNGPLANDDATSDPYSTWIEAKGKLNPR